MYVKVTDDRILSKQGTAWQTKPSPTFTDIQVISSCLRSGKCHLGVSSSGPGPSSVGPQSIPYSCLRNCEAFICTKGRCHQQRSGQCSAGKVTKLYCPGFGYTHEHSSVSHHHSTSALFQQPCTKVRNVHMGTSLQTGPSLLRIVYRISR